MLIWQWCVFVKLYVYLFEWKWNVQLHLVSVLLKNAIVDFLVHFNESVIGSWPHKNFKSCVENKTNWIFLKLLHVVVIEQFTKDIKYNSSVVYDETWNSPQWNNCRLLMKWSSIAWFIGKILEWISWTYFKLIYCIYSKYISIIKAIAPEIFMDNCMCIVDVYVYLF